MTTTIQTLQERLEERARDEAGAHARAAIAKLPRCAGNITIRKGFLGTDTDAPVWWGNMKEELHRFFEEQFYKQRLNELTKALVEDIVLKNEDE
jgi:hypothetical protein